MTVEMLKDCNKKKLARLAREQGITGWHAMRKDQLIRALTPSPSSAKPRNGRAAKPASVKPVARGRDSAARGSNGRSAAVSRRAPVVATPVRDSQPLPSKTLGHGCDKDRIIAMIRDPYWIHVYWELSRSTLARAQAALGQEWHTARPILRVMDVSSEDTTASAEQHVRDIPIHGGVNNWYVDVTQPPRSFRIDIGYLSRKGRFFVLSRSNVVSTPKLTTGDMFDQSWLGLERDYERVFHKSGGNDHAGQHSELRELFEERLRRPMNAMSIHSLGAGPFLSLGRKFEFEIDAELIVYGTTEPDAKVTLQGEPVQVRSDGTFSVRFTLPEARQIIPATATSADGVEERTIVLAVERNTKELEPTIHDGSEI